MDGSLDATAAGTLEENEELKKNIMALEAKLKKAEKSGLKDHVEDWYGKYGQGSKKQMRASSKMEEAWNG